MYIVFVPTVERNNPKTSKNLFFVGFLKAADEKIRIQIQIRIRNPVYGSRDPDPS
jgi:hypothetical protein